MRLDAHAMIVLAGLSLIIWLLLKFFRGGFWRADQFLSQSGSLRKWPAVVVIIPARNEEQTISDAVTSLAEQDYPGSIHIVVVDDESSDATQSLVGNWPNLHVIQGVALPKGWTGKLWAVQQGLNYVKAHLPSATFILMTDADIKHGRKNIRELVFKAESESLHLVSLMVMLRTKSFWEKLLIPAFVFFFQKLYPFSWVNDPKKKTAAAAGGCILIRRQTLVPADSLKTVRDQLIDDCAIGKEIKARGPIWLGITKETHSLRAYQSLQDVWNMVTRNAFRQLGYSSIALIVTVVGMVLTYLVPPITLFYGFINNHYAVAFIGGLAWIIMSLAYMPTLRYYGEKSWWVFWLPVTATLYTLMTFSSALRHWQGHGSVWKGRTYKS
tara:strand:- start:1059 stop:2207 length:1149 start_codon:yes stop_codon:yes gene_type:complete